MTGAPTTLRATSTPPPIRARGPAAPPRGAVEDEADGQATGVRAPHGRGAGRPVHPVVVHRRAGVPQERGDHRLGTGERLQRGDRVRWLVDRRVRTGPGSRHAGGAGCLDVPGPAVATGIAGRGPDVL